MTKGDLILLPFPFTDLSGSKLRPALVLMAGKDDVTVAFLTTQMRWKEPTDVVVEPAQENGLKRTSLVRLSKLATIDTDMVTGILGKLTEQQLFEVNNGLRSIFKLNE